VTDFTKAELDVLATATLLRQAGAGFTVDADRVEERETCDALVESGHLEAIEGTEGGYVLSQELENALALTTAMQADGARLS
jgi:hypothetical protein